MLSVAVAIALKYCPILMKWINQEMIMAVRMMNPRPNMTDSIRKSKSKKLENNRSSLARIFFDLPLSDE